MAQDCNLKETKTILVSNIPRDVTVDDLTIHFQSRKNGGDDVEEVVMLPDGNQALVIFEMANVVENVLKERQMINGTVVQVQRYESQRPQNKNDESSNNAVTTVFVSGFEEATTDETIYSFFESKEQSGGGELTEFRRTGPSEACLTFKYSKDAENVLEKSDQLRFGDFPVRITTSREPTDDESVLIVRDLSSDTSEETLKNYIEVITNKEVVSLVFGKNNDALVYLKGETDYNCIKQSKERLLNGSKVNIKFAPVTNAIKITNIPSSATKHDIIYKFENGNRGGGRISDLMLDNKNGVAKVVFEDYSVASKQAGKKHILRGTELGVTPYYDCFEEQDEETAKEYSGKLSVKSDVMNFIVDRAIINKFNLNSLKYDLDAEMLQFSKIFENSEEMESFQSKFKSFLESFASETITVPKDISPKLQKFLDEKREELQDVSIITNKESQSINIVGYKERVIAIKNSISAHIDHLKEKMKPETTKFSIGTDKNKSIFLNSIDYSKKLMIEFPDIRIGGPDIVSGEIICVGTKESVQDVKMRISQDVQAITETRLKMSKQQIEFLKRTNCQVVNIEFKNIGINAMLILKSLKVSGSPAILQPTLMTLKIHDDISNLRNIVLSLTSEKSEQVDETTGRFLAKSDRMSKFQEQQYEKHGVMVELADSGEIWVVGEESKVSCAVQLAKMFTEANKIITAAVKIDHIQARFLASYRAKDISDVAEGLSEEGVKIECDGSAGSIVVAGTESGRKQAIESLQSLSDKVVSKDFEIKAPGIRKQMKLDSTRDMIVGIEKKNECIIERIDAQKWAAAAIIKNVPTVKAIPKTATSTSFYENVSVISDKEIRVEGGKKISVVIGDLSQVKVDVIVNTTNDKLDLKANPCGKALLHVAGKELQRECKKIGSLPIGGIAMTKQGKLNCKRVYHVNCAAWNNGEGETVLRDILKICLNAIKVDEFKSIAIPTIGTGNLKFPHSVVAKMFFEEVLKFLTSNPQTTLKDVRFVAHHRDKASIDAFLGEIKSMKPISSVAVSNFGDEVMYTHSGLLKSIKSLDGNLDIFLDKDVKVQIIQGDITKESTELIMHVTNCKLSLRGGVAKSLTRVGGDVIAKECNAMLPVNLFSVHFTSAGKLSVPKIAHVVAPDRPTEADLAKCLEKFLIAVKEKKIQQISFSAIGAGVIGLSEKNSANLILTALTKHLTNENSTLKLVRIVVFEKQKFVKFKDAVEVFSTGISPRPQNPTSKVAEMGDAADGQPCIRIHAWDASIIDKTWNEFKSKMEEHIVTKDLRDPNIKTVSKEEIKEIERLKEIHDVEINVNKEEGVVKIRGHSTDITEVQHKIFEMIKKKMSHEHKSSSVQVPDYWDPQPKETKVHKVTLQNTSSEYKKVSDHFLKTASSVNIQKIERIQNPSIYKLYAQKRKLMDEKNGSNERLLFHGTYRDVLDSIDNGGLNRRFAGKNAKVFGRGVYFARDASYSCQFSPPDDQGLRYVYYARVLVGEYTLGESSMIVPPLKSPSDPNEKYDSVVDNINNPNIFVLFHDYESYTEYLITFK